LPASSSRKRRLPWGCMVPLRDFNRARSTRWSSTSTAFPSSAFRTPSTACTVLDLPDVFQPGATYRVLPSGVSTSRSAVPARRWPVPSRRCPPKPLPTVARPRHDPERCPQGLAPHENPSPDATVFSHCAGDDPLLGFSSSRFSAPASRNRLGRLRRS